MTSSPANSPAHYGGGDRASYDGGGGGDLATAVYRRDNTGTSHPIAQPPGEKKKSAVPFILGMIALAVVGFSLVALIISYVQTGKLPFR